MSSVLSAAIWKVPLFCLLIVVLRTPVLHARDTDWMRARIVEVKTNSTRPPAWIVDTPGRDDRPLCTVRVHLGDRIVQASYSVDQQHPAPPPEWVKHAPVYVRFEGKSVVLKSFPGLEYRLRLAYAEKAPTMDPWTPEEVAAQKDPEEGTQPAGSMIGFDNRSSSTTKPANSIQEGQEPQKTAEPLTGSVRVASVPYLAEIFVEGESMGYTPAKLKLLPGKHTVRCEKRGYKPWSKEITVTADSELTVDATLPSEQK